MAKAIYIVIAIFFIFVPIVIREADQAKLEGKSRTILFNLCGHGNFDMKAYEDYFAGKIVDHELSQAEIDESRNKLNTPMVS